MLMYTNIDLFSYVGNGEDNIILVFLVCSCRKMGSQYSFCHRIIETVLKCSVGLSICWMHIIHIGFLLIITDAFVCFLYAMGVSPS